MIGGHTCGVIGGFTSYYLLVEPHNLMLLTEAFSPSGLLLGLGAVLAISITTFLMIWLQVSHPPACATTLIISLGILPNWTDGLFILLAVVILYYSYWVFQKLTPDREV